jgi:hypothetical protein
MLQGNLLGDTFCGPFTNNYLGYAQWILQRVGLSNCDDVDEWTSYNFGGVDIITQSKDFPCSPCEVTELNKRDRRVGTCNVGVSWEPVFTAVGGSTEKATHVYSDGESFSCSAGTWNLFPPQGDPLNPPTPPYIPRPRLGAMASLRSTTFSINSVPVESSRRIIVTTDNFPGVAVIPPPHSLSPSVSDEGRPGLKYSDSFAVPPGPGPIPVSMKDSSLSVVLDGDVDGNGVIDRSDRLAMVQALGQTLAGTGPFNLRADVWTDGVIDINDWKLLATAPGLFDCIADIASEPQTLGPDGQLTAADFIVFYNRFFAGSLVADIASAGQKIAHDGELTADDIIVFNNRYFAGCD